MHFLKAFRKPPSSFRVWAGTFVACIHEDIVDGKAIPFLVRKAAKYEK